MICPRSCWQIWAKSGASHLCYLRHISGHLIGLQVSLISYSMNFFSENRWKDSKKKRNNQERKKEKMKKKRIHLGGNVFLHLSRLGGSILKMAWKKLPKPMVIIDRFLKKLNCDYFNKRSFECRIELDNMLGRSTYQTCTGLKQRQLWENKLCPLRWFNQAFHTASRAQRHIPIYNYIIFAGLRTKDGKINRANKMNCEVTVILELILFCSPHINPIWTLRLSIFINKSLYPRSIAKWWRVR